MDEKLRAALKAKLEWLLAEIVKLAVEKREGVPIDAERGVRMVSTYALAVFLARLLGETDAANGLLSIVEESGLKPEALLADLWKGGPDDPS